MQASCLDDFIYLIPLLAYLFSWACVTRSHYPFVLLDIVIYLFLVLSLWDLLLSGCFTLSFKCWDLVIECLNYLDYMFQDNCGVIL